MSDRTMVKKDITSLRSTLDHLSERAGQLMVTHAEVDPHLEMAGIQKALDAGPAILFENVKGYPGARLLTNLFASEERLSDIFGVEPHKFKFMCVEAFRHPLPPREVKDAPCQEVVIDRDIDVWDVVPMISHTPTDPGRTLGGGNTLVCGKHFWGGTHVSMNRMNFRGKDFSSFQISPGSHTDMIATEWYKKGPIPMTINMGVPPAVSMLAGSGFMYQILPRGSDELGVAGAIQGSPIDIVKARTVDAYAMAEAEIVIEGYLDTTQHVWESEEAEKDGKQGVHPFHPEWSGYLGRAYRTYKFQATAITFRKNRPVYYPMIVHSFDSHNISAKVREATFLELADRICPDLVVDVHCPLGLTDWGGVIFQVKKRRSRDEGFQKNILTTAIAASQGMRIAIAVDEDVDLYNAEDILWAMTTRVDPAKDIQTVCAGGMGQTFQPAERAAAAPGAQWIRSESKYAGGIAMDATVPFQYKWAFERARYPIDRVDLRRWFSEEDIATAQLGIGDYARYLARVGI